MENNILNFIAEFKNMHFIFSVSLSAWMIFGCLALLVIIIFIFRWKNQKFELSALKLKIYGQAFSFNIVRNFQNLEIAHKIYIELITRKAAILIDEDKDIIIEIYNSWYELFSATRNEIKNINGELLKSPKSEELINMATQVLNKGLRPHLTQYQGRFRHWYKKQIANEKNFDLCPQDIQRKFPEFDELIESMKEVNKLLISYSEQLRIFIYGNKVGHSND